MRPRSLKAAVLAVLALGSTTYAVTPAAAQFVFVAPLVDPFLFPPRLHRPPVILDELTPAEIAHLLRRRGFRDLGRIAYDDDVALVPATGPDGRRVRVAVDVFHGRVIGATPIRDERRRIAQRAPGQGDAARRAEPQSRRDIRAAPESQPQRSPSAAPPPTPRPPAAGQPAATPAPPRAATTTPGTRENPRRIDIPPPAALDETTRPRVVPPPSAAPKAQDVPVAPLE